MWIQGKWAQNQPIAGDHVSPGGTKVPSKLEPVYDVSKSCQCVAVGTRQERAQYKAKGCRQAQLFAGSNMSHQRTKVASGEKGVGERKG